MTKSKTSGWLLKKWVPQGEDNWKVDAKGNSRSQESVPTGLTGPGGCVPGWFSLADGCNQCWDTGDTRVSSPLAAECTELPAQLGDMPLASILTYLRWAQSAPWETGTQACIIPHPVLPCLVQGGGWADWHLLLTWWSCTSSQLLKPHPSEVLKPV